MVPKFERDGITFSYPENWIEEIEADQNGWTAVVQSPGAAFMCLTLDLTAPGIGEMADAALEAMRSEYPKLDAEPVCETIAGRAAVGYDVDFISLDTTISCVIRAIAAAPGTILVLSQSAEAEKTNLQVLEAIRVSLQINDG